MEDVYFSEGLQWLVENLPPEELAYPHPDAGLKAAHYLKGKYIANTKESHPRQHIFAPKTYCSY